MIIYENGKREKFNTTDNETSDSEYSIEKNKQKTEKVIDTTEEDTTETKKRYYIVEPGYVLGGGDFSNMDRLKFDFITNYKIDSHFAWGFASGVRYFKEDEYLYVPVYLNLRLQLEAENSTPFVKVGAGYTHLLIPDENEGSVFLTSNLGMKIKTHKNFDVLLSIGYDFQTRKLYDYIKQTENIKGLSLNLGISIY